MHFFLIFIFSANIEVSICKLLYDMLLPLCMTAISGLPCSKCGVTCFKSCIVAPLTNFVIYFALLKELFSLFLLIFFELLPLTVSVFSQMQ